MAKHPLEHAPDDPATHRHGKEAGGFKAWMSEVQHVLTFVAEPDEWRRYYDAGLSPLDAIAQHNTDEDVS